MIPTRMYKPSYMSSHLILTSMKQALDIRELLASSIIILERVW